MLEKKASLHIQKFESDAVNVSESLHRLMVLSNGEYLLITNNETHYIFSVYNDSDVEYSFMVDYSHGVLTGVTFFKGSFYIEFIDTLGMYAEEYNIVKGNKLSVEHYASFPRESYPRESYQHDMPYFSLFQADGELYLNMIRHNRLHTFTITPKGPEEMEVMEGGKWYLCGGHSVCHVGETVEVYDQTLNLCCTMEYDYNIDEISYASSLSPSIFVVALGDYTYEQTTMIVVHGDTGILHATTIEYLINDIGMSGGRVWINPYGYNSHQDRIAMVQQDMGGCMIYDRFAWPLYVHLRSKNISNGSFIGAYPPPFHHSEGIYPMPEGMTVVVEAHRLILMDYNCNVLQEIATPHPQCVSTNNQGKVVVLNVDRQTYSHEGLFTQDNATIDIYEWAGRTDDGKIIEMLNFQR